MPINWSYGGSPVVVDNNNYLSDRNYVGELARFEERSGVNTVLTTGTVQIPGSVISVPANNNQVIMEFSAAIQITTAGSGLIIVGLYETTTGAAVALGSGTVSGTFTLGTGSQYQQIPTMRLSIGKVTSPREFCLQGLIFRDSGSSLAASVRSSVNDAPTAPFSYLSATAVRTI